MKAIDRLAIGQKLGLLGVVFALIFAVPTGLFLQQVGSDLATTRHEAQGVERALAANAFIRALAAHQAASAATLAGDASLVAARDAARGEGDASLAQWRAKVAGPPGAVESLAAIDKSWSALTQAVPAGVLSQTETATRHAEIAAAAAGVVDAVIEDDGLAFDANPLLHHAATAAFRHVPAITIRTAEVEARSLAALASHAATPEERAMLTTQVEKLKEALAALQATIEKAGALDVTARARLGPAVEALQAMAAEAIRATRVDVVFNQQLDRPLAEHRAAHDAALDAVKAFALVAADEARTLLTARAETDRLRMLAAVGAAIAGFVGALAFGIWTGRAIARPIAYSVKVADGIAAGRLDHDIDPGRAKNREAARLLSSFAAMQQALSALVQEMRGAGDAVRHASSQVAGGNATLSARTEQQAANLEETAATMEELTATVRRNAENASRAASVVADAATSAAHGGEAVDGVVRSMETIDAASGRIADVSAVIDAIAFQTNILALNAAVEAARAGESGRGFAVVAAEVRALAQRSAASAREIKGLVQGSVDAARDGSRQVASARSAMEEIRDSVGRVTEIYAQIVAASAEQGNGIEQVNRAVADMDRATQENAALVGRAAAASRALEEQAQRLAALVTRFQLKAGAAVESAASPVADLAPATTPADTALGLDIAADLPRVEDLRRRMVAS